jgi:hypothetical protein
VGHVSPETETARDSFLGHILAIEINDFLPHRGDQARNRSRVIPNILHLLDHIDKHRAEGNFYITSDLVKDFPEVVSLVSSRGHEIGLCCDFKSSQCPGEFGTLKEEIERLTGNPVNGIMIKVDKNRGRERLKQIVESGFDYCLTDFKMPLRGATLPLRIDYGKNLPLSVFPPSLYKLWGVNLAYGEPGKIRLYPFWFLRRCIRYQARNNMPAIINFPLWEFDPHLPRKVLSPLQSLRSYGNLSLAEFKLTRMLLEFDFVKIPELLKSINI